MAADGRLPLDRLSGAGAAVGYTLTWTGTRWVASAASGDSDHAGGGTNSTAVGVSATSPGNQSVGLGYSANAASNYSTALGYDATSSGDYAIAVGYSADTTATASIAIGAFSSATTGAGNIALGPDSAATGTRSIAIGNLATNARTDNALIKANDLEVNRSDGMTGASGLILTSPDGTRWKVTVTNAGALTVAAA